MKPLKHIGLIIVLYCAFMDVNAEGKTVDFDRIDYLTKTNLKDAEVLINQTYFNNFNRLTANDSIVLLYFHAFTLVNIGQIDTALSYFNKCVELADKQNMRRIKVLSRFEIGNIYYNWGRYDEALHQFLKAQKESLIYNDKLGQAEALNYIGKYHHSKGEFHKSVEYFNQALLLANRCDNTELKVVLYANIGKYYESISQYNQALFHYMNALRMLDSVENRIIRGTVYNHLGNLYQAIGKYQLSLEYHQKSLHERNILGYPEGISKSFKNIGEVHLAMNQTDTAMSYFKWALVYAKKVNYQKGYIKAMLDMGSIYLLQNQNETCRRYCIPALKLSEKSGYDKGIIQANYTIGTSYYNDGNYKKAETFLLGSLKDAETADMNDKICENSHALSKLYRNMADTAKTFAYLTKYYETRIITDNDRTLRQIADLELNYQMEQKEKANEILRKENEINALSIARKNSFIILYSIILLFTISVIIAYYLRFKSKQKANQQLATLNTEIIKQNRNLARLNEQLSQANKEKDNFFSIIAHELRNPLWWFRNLAETLSHNYKTMPEEKLGRAIQSLDESAKNAFHLTDNLLQWSKSQLNRNSFQPSEINVAELMEENLKLWNTAYQYKNIEILFHTCPESYILADRDMVNTIIRNLLSNAIKYTYPNGKIEINIYKSQTHLNVSIKDSGIGISKSNLKKLFNPNHQFSTLGIMQEKGSGIGLKLCKDFMELNSGNINVESNENVGTTFICSFPVLKQEVYSDFYDHKTLVSSTM